MEEENIVTFKQAMKILDSVVAHGFSKEYFPDKTFESQPMTKYAFESIIRAAYEEGQNKGQRLATLLISFAYIIPAIAVKEFRLMTFPVIWLYFMIYKFFKALEINQDSLLRAWAMGAWALFLWGAIGFGIFEVLKIVPVPRG